MATTKQLVSRIGDKGSHGGFDGSIVSVTGKVLCKGKLVALDGDIYECSKHGRSRLNATSEAIFNGKRVVRVGDSAECGAVIQEGADSVLSF